MTEPKIPTDDAAIAEIIAAGQRGLVAAIDAIEVPKGFETEPSPAYRVLRARPR